jgi:hypothetical protein
MSQAIQSATEEYREQLRQLTEAMSITRNEVPKVEVDSQFQLDVFAEENYDKRLDKLQMQLEFVQDAFENLHELFEAYTLEQLMKPYDRQMSDGAAFIDWLTGRSKLNRKQKDYLAVARARLQIQDIARLHRRSHVRFQELYSIAQQMLPDLETNDRLRLYLNPIRTRAKLLTDSFLEGEKPPVEAVFFAHGYDIRTAILGKHGLALLEELAQHVPATIESLAAVSVLADHEEMMQFARQLVELGLAALG